MISHVCLLANVLFTLPSAVARLAIPVAGRVSDQLKHGNPLVIFFLTVLICHIFVARPSSPPPSRPATNGKWASSCRFCVSNTFYLGLLCPAFIFGQNASLLGTLMRLRAFLRKWI